MTALKAGDVTVGVVTKVTANLAVVKAQGMRGIIPGLGTGKVEVGERLKLRVVDLKGENEFIAARI